MFVLSVLEAPNTKTNSLCVQTHLAIKLFLILILISHNSDFMTHNCEFISCNSDFTSQKKSQNCEFVSCNYEKKSKNCEIKKS